MKNNNKGFVLAETLVVTVFVMAIFTIIYLNFYPLLGKYQQRENYDDADSKLNAYWFKRFIQDETIVAPGKWTTISTSINANGGYIFKCSTDENEDCSDVESSYRDLFRTYMNETGCKKIIITKYNLEASQHINGEEIDAATKRSQFKGRRPSGKKIFIEDDNGMKTYLGNNEGFKEYINYLPAFKFPSVNGANYRIIIHFKRKKDAGNSKENMQNTINAYSTIELKR